MSQSIFGFQYQQHILIIRATTTYLITRFRRLSRLKRRS